MDTGIRLPRISALAAWTRERVTARCQATGTIAPEDALPWPRSRRGTNCVDHGRCRRRSSFAERRAMLIARTVWNCASCLQVARSTRSSASSGSPRSGSAARVASATCAGRVLHDGVEQRLAGREVHVDGRAHDPGAASDLGHAGIGIARQRFEGGVDDGGDAALGVRPAAFRGGRSACVFVFAIVQWMGIACGLSRSFGEEVLRAREDGQRHQAGERSDERGDQERVARSRMPPAGRGSRRSRRRSSRRSRCRACRRSRGRSS